MNLKNYTSSVPANDSIFRIEQMLVEAGASHIAKTYEDGLVSGIIFQIRLNDMPLTFKLPAKIKPIFDAMWSGIKKPIPTTKKRLEEQSQRTAWKLVYDWVAVQLSMIRLEQTEPAEVFFPFLYNPAKDQTYFATLKEGGFKQLQLESPGRGK
jgi:hypothetical protein